MLNRYDELANAPKRFETAHPCLNILRNNSNAWNVEVTEYATSPTSYYQRSNRPLQILARTPTRWTDS